MATSEKDFETLARQQQSVGVTGELLAFLQQSKKWWLLPILAILLTMGAVLMLSGTAAAPFIYSLF